MCDACQPEDITVLFVIKSFYYHGACIFNSLPTDIKILPPKERFKAISDFYS